MQETRRIFQDITSNNFNNRNYSDRIRIFNDFAKHFGWHPSDYLGPEYSIESKTNGHLIVEHGLEHSAVITFITDPIRTMDLNLSESRSLLEISYNNLVDFHLIVDQNIVTIYFNRSESPKLEQKEIEAPDFNALRAKDLQETFDFTQNANIPALDTVMIETIDYWKRFLYGEIRCKNKNEALSALFNAIIFVRAIEDHYKIKHGNSQPPLYERWREADQKDLITVLKNCLKSYKAGRGVSSLISFDRLNDFNCIDNTIIENMFSDFYRIKRTPYVYNFALMSRHALSRIYEKYVALLRQESKSDIKQDTLFNINLPETQINKAAGAIYTPQFIPRFFCRFIEEQLPPRIFRELKIIDPACGSGIFLRTFLEKKIEKQGLSTSDIRECFKNSIGLDIDENACQASKLSLALLHLMRTDQLPSSKVINVLNEEAISYYQKNKKLQKKFGAVIGNPPFIRLELQSEQLREHIKQFLNEKFLGRADLYLGILKMSMDMVKPQGFLAFVLPHSFLIGKAPSTIRQDLCQNFWIRSIVDLSSIHVFEDYSAYVVLLIAQKKAEITRTPQPCKVVLCQEFIGKALQECIENKTIRTPYYSVFNVEQDYFSNKPWILLGPEETSLRTKLSKFETLDKFLIVREGLITGSDDHYIFDVDSLPKHEKKLFSPFLPDRDIERYTVPKKSNKYVYYPYSNGKRISIDDIKKYDKTWSYLNKIKKELSKSAANTWPYLVRAREKELLQPKIITPHLMLLPRFSIDLKGEFAVSRAPFLIPRAENKENDLDFLKYFLAVLNSSVVHWYLGSHAYRFSRGYVKLDPKYVSQIPVPDPSLVPPTCLKNIIELVDNRINTGNPTIENKIDKEIINLYALNSSEIKLLKGEL